MTGTLFKNFDHAGDDFEFRDEYKSIIGEPDNLLKSIAKGMFFRWVVRDEDWARRIE